MRSTHLALYIAAVLTLAVTSGAAADAGKHLFILSGQSNMAGHRPEEAFTPAVQAALGKDKVIVVQDAQGGQPIQRWWKAWKSPQGETPKTRGDLYDRLMNKVKPAIAGQSLTSVTFIWMQGERDAKMRWAEVYQASLKGLYGQLSRDLARKDVNFVIGRLSDFDMTNKRYPHWTKIRAVQVTLAESEARFSWVNTDDLNDGVNRQGKSIKNDLHYSAQGYQRLGQRFAQSALALIKQHSGLRLLTWNVLHGNRQYRGVAAVLRSADADVVCLQEVTPGLESCLRESLADRFPHMVFGARSSIGDGYAVLSRFPVTETEHLQNSGLGRPAGRVEILTEAGRIQVLNLHLTYPQVGSGSLVERAQSYVETAAVRRVEVQHFCKSLDASVPALVAGDFNSFEDEASVRYLSEELGLVDAYRALHPERSVADVTWCQNGDPAALMQARIDYVFASRALSPLAAEPISSLLSDHRPVTAVFRLASPAEKK